MSGFICQKPFRFSFYFLLLFFFFSRLLTPDVLLHLIFFFSFSDASPEKYCFKGSRESGKRQRNKTFFRYFCFLPLKKKKIKIKKGSSDFFLCHFLFPSTSLFSSSSSYSFLIPLSGLVINGRSFTGSK